MKYDRSDAKCLWQERVRLSVSSRLYTALTSGVGTRRADGLIFKLSLRDTQAPAGLGG